jgi:capsular polysaccharide biosynthesis protein
MKISAISISNRFSSFQRSFLKALTIPLRILRKVLKHLASLSIQSALKITSLIKVMLPAQVKTERISTTYQLVPLDQIAGFIKITETSGGIEKIILPKIVGLSNGGSISVDMPGDYLCKLNNVSFVPNSDFIRDEKGHVANEKLLRKEYDVLIPRDKDIIEIKDRIIRLYGGKYKIYSKAAFNLMGTYSYHWAHFFSQYYPKLSFLKDLPKSVKIDLIIPKNTDPHIRYLIDYELKIYPDIGVREVDTDAEIVCEKLYHVSLGNCVGDDGYFPTPLACLISNSTLKFWNKKAVEFIPKDSKQYRKIFIGRTGRRSLKNYNEVLNFFIEKGFEEIFPHLLNIEDKIRIFSEAKYIVGPGSSGFVNSIYSQAGTKILVFINSFRYMDTYLAGLSNYMGHQFWLMSGKDDNLRDMNSSYEISLNEIKIFIERNDFFNFQA